MMSVNCTKLSCFARKIFVLFAKRMVTQNAAVRLACCVSALIRPLSKSSLFMYACVCVLDHTWTTPFFFFLLPYGFSLVQMVRVKTFPQYEY